MLFLRFFLCLFLLGVTPAQAGLFNPVIQKLKNGMTVAVVEHHRAPVVSHMVWYNVGAADEEPGKSGAAHFFEHMMFQGTSAMPGDSFSKRVQAHGGRGNAFTSYDYTAYFQNIAAQHLPMVMAMEADRMVNLSLETDAIKDEQRVILEERLTRYENEPTALLDERMRSALFFNHPYGRTVIGSMAEIDALTPDDLRSFYHSWYAPNNAVLVVTGDVKPETVFALAEETYGKIEIQPLPERKRRSAEAVPATARIMLPHPEVRQPLWRRLYLAPNLKKAGARKAAAIEVLADMLGEGSLSYLYRRLVMEEKIAVSIGASYQSDSALDSYLSLYAVPQDGRSLEELEAAIELELARFVEQGLAEDFLADTKERMVAGLAFLRDDIGSAGRILGRTLVLYGDPAPAEEWEGHIRGVTKADILEAFNTVFTDKAMVTGLLLPEGDAP